MPLQPPARAFLRGWRVTKNEKVYQLRWAAWFKKERLEGRLEGDEERYILLRLLLLLSVSLFSPSSSPGIS